MIKAIFFDVDDTLLDFHKNAEYDALECAKQFELELPSNFMETFDEINNQLWEQIQQGSLTIEQLLRIRWKTILQKLQIVTDYEAFEMAFVQKLKECAIQVDYAYETVAYLAKKYPLYIASNASQQQQEKRLKIAQMDGFFQQIYTSQIAQASKPQKEFFDFCLKQCGYQKQEVVMIGDSISADIAGAKQYGLKTIWYNPKGLPASEYADEIISDLRELRQIL